MMNLASVAIQVLPMNCDTPEVVRVVDKAIEYIKSFELPTQVGPFETTVEGDYDILMTMVSGVSKICLEAGCGQIMTYVKICAAKEHSVLTMAEKTEKHQS